MLWYFCLDSDAFTLGLCKGTFWWMCQDKSAARVSGSKENCVCAQRTSAHAGVKHTCWKQLRTLGSMLEPPNAATSPSCLGIWMASWSRRPSCLWSHVSPADATWLNRSWQAEQIRGQWGRKQGLRINYNTCIDIVKKAWKGTSVTTHFCVVTYFLSPLKLEFSVPHLCVQSGPRILQWHTGPIG